MRPAGRAGSFRLLLYCTDTDRSSSRRRAAAAPAASLRSTRRNRGMSVPDRPNTLPELPGRAEPTVRPLRLVAAPDETAAETPVPAPFRSAPPVVRLLRDESTQHPVALAIAAAWSCYGGRPAKVENVLKLIGEMPPGLTEAELAGRASKRDRALRLYADLFAAGHHTTLQHATFVFVLDNVSRLAIWSFFHAHPFYNSEQVSQRYREVTGETMVTPDHPPAELAIYIGAFRRAPFGIRSLTALLA